MADPVTVTSSEFRENVGAALTTAEAGIAVIITDARTGRIRAVLSPAGDPDTSWAARSPAGVSSGKVAPDG